MPYRGWSPPAVSETAEQLMALLALDQQLKQQATVIYATVDLAAWQKSFHPPETAWWWYLSEPVHRLDRHDWLWNTLTVIALTASGSLLVDISGKFLTGGPGLLGSFTVLSQSVMTVATAGGVLTQQGPPHHRAGDRQLGHQASPLARNQVGPVAAAVGGADGLPQ
jgi:hypothetical protein